jgi:hypothetical protein
MVGFAILRNGEALGAISESVVSFNLNKCRSRFLGLKLDERVTWGKKDLQGTQKAALIVSDFSIPTSRGIMKIRAAFCTRRDELTEVVQAFLESLWRG